MNGNGTQLSGSVNGKTDGMVALGFGSSEEYASASAAKVTGGETAACMVPDEDDGRRLQTYETYDIFTLELAISNTGSVAETVDLTFTTAEMMTQGFLTAASLALVMVLLMALY